MQIIPQKAVIRVVVSRGNAYRAKVFCSIRVVTPQRTTNAKYIESILLGEVFDANVALFVIQAHVPHGGATIGVVRHSLAML